MATVRYLLVSARLGYELQDGCGLRDRHRAGDAAGLNRGLLLHVLRAGVGREPRRNARRAHQVRYERPERQSAILPVGERAEIELVGREGLGVGEIRH